MDSQHEKNDRADDRLELFVGHIAQDHVPCSQAQEGKGQQGEQLPPVRMPPELPYGEHVPEQEHWEKNPHGHAGGQGHGHEHHHQDAAARNSCLGYSYARACSEHDKPPPQREIEPGKRRKKIHESASSQ